MKGLDRVREGENEMKDRKNEDKNSNNNFDSDNNLTIGICLGPSGTRLHGIWRTEFWAISPCPWPCCMWRVP